MNEIPNEIATAAAGLLAAYVPGLTPAKLAAALSAPADDLGPLMTVKEAAEVLHVSRRTVERLISDPESGVARLTVRGAVRVLRADVLAVIKPAAARSCGEDENVDWPKN